MFIIERWAQCHEPVNRFDFNFLKSVPFKWTLHSKLPLDFFSGPKSIYFWKIFTIKKDLDWCRRYLDILGRNVLKDTDVYAVSSRLPQAIFRIAGFHAKNSTDSTSLGVQHWPKYLPYWCVVIYIITIHIIRNFWFDFINRFCCIDPIIPVTKDATVIAKAS